jgi:hypothetical protein
MSNELARLEKSLWNDGIESKWSDWFRYGSLWFPVQSPGNVDRKLIKPIFDKGDFGGMMPVIQIKAPDIFDSTVIPYENIVDFDMTIMKGESAPGIAMTGTLTFIDQTPLFIETIIRSIRNLNITGSTSNLSLRFGWRMNRVPDQLQMPEFNNNIDNNLLLSKEYNLTIVSATYKYTTFGVMSNLTFTFTPKTILDALKTKVTNSESIFACSFTNPTPVEIANSLTNIINNSGVKDKIDADFRVIIIGSDNIKTNILFNTIDPLTSPAEQSLTELLDKFVNTLYCIPKSDPLGKVHYFVSESKEVGFDKIADKDVKVAYYPIYIYAPDNEAEKDRSTPILEYPAYETPIMEWQPEMTTEAQNLFLVGKRITTIDENGKIIQSIENVQSVTAGEIAPSDTKGVVSSKTSPLNEQQTESKMQKTIATLSITIPGDPLFTDNKLFMTRFEVRNNGISQMGIVRESSDFFNNFPGLIGNQGSNLKSIIMDMNDVAQQSPFNGLYVLNGWSHKIKAGEGYKTSLDFMWKV